MKKNELSQQRHHYFHNMSSFEINNLKLTSSANELWTTWSVMTFLHVRDLENLLKEHKLL